VDATVVRVEVRGRVQGVGYRWALSEQARRLGVGGWVRNRRDGSVEAVLSGPREAVDALLAWARRGPPDAVVERLEAFGAEGRFDSFEQRPTA
jgi:acylphosphatase